MPNNEKGVTEQEISNMVKETMKKFEAHDVYYILKTMGLRYLKETTVEQVRVCLALNDLGFPITSYTITLGISQKRVSQSVYMLHNLGDRKVLTLVRDRDIKRLKGLRWILNPNFLERFDRDK